MWDDAEYLLYLGAYTSGESTARGIGLLTLDRRGRPVSTGRFTEVADPSFLAASTDGSVVYAVNEQHTGRVTALAVCADGTLREINSQPSLGREPCHIAVHPGGRFVLTANYASGNLVVHPIGDGGALREPCHVVEHSGSGPRADRQSGSHPHQVLPDPSGRYVLAVDLGTDSIHVYAFDEHSGHLTLEQELGLEPGSGPRHLAFAPSGERAYLVAELTSTITELVYEPETGRLSAGRVLPTAASSSAGTNLAAEVVVTPRGRFVLVSNRGDDSIAVFGTGAGGELEALGRAPARVAGPRHMAFSPDGELLHVAGLGSDEVVALRVEQDGALTQVGPLVPVAAPACVLPMPAPGREGQAISAS